MDVNVIRSVITLICFVAFVGIVVWAYSRKRKSEFDEAAHLPFAEDSALCPSSTRPGNEHQENGHG